MKLFLWFFVAAPMAYALTSAASERDAIPLDELLRRSDVMVEGVVVSGSAGQCGNEQKYVYHVRKTKLWKGAVGEDFCICGDSSDLLIGGVYFIAGRSITDNKIEYLPEAAYMALAEERYFKPNVYKSMIVRNGSANEYVLAVEDSTFLSKLREYLYSELEKK